MARVKGSGSDYQEVDTGVKAARVVGFQPDLGALGGGIGGAYQACVTSGALTAITAYTSSAGHLAAFRNANTAKVCIIERILARLQLVVGPSAAQEFGLLAVRTSAHTVQPAAGGAAVAVTTPAFKKRGGTAYYPPPGAALYYANSTTVLTAGTYTPDTQPLAERRAWALAAAATVQLIDVTLDLDFTGRRPLVLGPDEGFLIGNSILMANSLAARLTLQVDWAEAASFPQ